MDGQTFDRIAKTLAEARSRRSVVQALVGGGAGGALAVLGETAGAAGRCRTVGQACKTNEDCCPGLTRNGNVACISTGRKQKSCQCANAADPCGGACCAEDEFCEAGFCEACRESGDCTLDVECCSGVCNPYNGQCNLVI
jgi:hypothetical protein